MKKLDILVALIVALSWGSNFIAVKYSVSEVPVFLTLSIRFFIISAILWPFVSRPKADFRDIYAASIIFAVFYISLVYYAIYLGINTSLAVILMQLSTPFSIIIARIALKEHFTRNAIIGIIIAFIGTLVIIGTPSAVGNYLATIIIIFGAFFNAIFNVQSRKLKAVPPISLLFWNSLIAVPHLLLISYFLEGNPLELLQNTTYIFWSSIFYTVVIAGIVGMVSWIYLLQKYPVYQVMPFSLLIPPVGVFFSVLIFNEPISWHLIFGGCMTAIGVAVTQSRRKI